MEYGNLRREREGEREKDREREKARKIERGRGREIFLSTLYTINFHFTALAKYLCVDLCSLSLSLSSDLSKTFFSRCLCWNSEWVVQWVSRHPIAFFHLWTESRDTSILLITADGFLVFSPQNFGKCLHVCIVCIVVFVCFVCCFNSLITASLTLDIY